MMTRRSARMSRIGAGAPPPRAPGRGVQCGSKQPARPSEFPCFCTFPLPCLLRAPRPLPRVSVHSASMAAGNCGAGTAPRMKASNVGLLAKMRFRSPMPLRRQNCLIATMGESATTPGWRQEQRLEARGCACVARGGRAAAHGARKRRQRLSLSRDGTACLMLLPAYLRTTFQKQVRAPKKVSKQCRTRIASQGPTRENPQLTAPLDTRNSFW
ncbi:unnamed protein product [Prorocentrum cordatum]|uniref:Uncharacterized protein n=1 Tax=Prorocentrum cordatum TaxID=2364126 RepID=A0ABN9X4B4_9DINO|nr:unnamed protein product [Polarella glacialis]